MHAHYLTQAYAWKLEDGVAYRELRPETRKSQLKRIRHKYPLRAASACAQKAHSTPKMSIVFTPYPFGARLLGVGSTASVAEL
jgi:hypothetical protein